MLTIGDPMIDSLSESYRNAITAIGENPEREGLLDTPKRAAKALEILTSGYRQDLETLVNGAVFESENDEMVVVRDIELYSMCEHHMLPFTGLSYWLFAKRQSTGVVKVCTHYGYVRETSANPRKSHTGDCACGSESHRGSRGRCGR